MIDISPAATPESMPCCNSISTPTPAAESSAISRAAMTNIHATGFSSDVTCDLYRPAPAVLHFPVRGSYGRQNLYPRIRYIVFVVGSAGHNSLYCGTWPENRCRRSSCAERRTARFKFCRVPVSTIRPLSSTTTRLAS